MENAALTVATVTLEQMEFQQNVFIYLGIIYFALLLYWIFSLWKDISSKLSESSEKTWTLFGLGAGVGFGILACAEWGWPTAGTAFSIGLCIGMALIHPAAAICLLASSLFLRPWELIEKDSYLSLLPRFSFALCLAHLLLRYAQEKKITIERSRLSLILVAFAGWCFLSTIFAPEGAGALGQFFDVFVKSILLYFILVEMVRDSETFKMLIGTLLFSFLFVGLVSVFQTEDDLRLKGFGAFKNSNDIASLMVFILPFAVMTFLRKREAGLLRFVGLSLGVVALAAVLLSRSRGAMLGIFAMLGVYAVARVGRKALVPVGATLVILAIPAMVVLSNRSSDDLQQSSEGRKTYLKAGLRMGAKNPVFGVGFNSYPINLQNYNTESLDEGKQMTAHNSWVLVFAETGFVGLFLFSLAFFWCIWMAWQMYPFEPELLLALVGYGVTIFFLSHSYLMYPYLLYALVQIASRLRKLET